MNPSSTQGSPDIVRAALFVALICDQHDHQPGCTDPNHRRDVHYRRECLLMLGLIDEHNRLVDIKS